MTKAKTRKTDMDNGKNGRVYPDKSKVRKKMTAKERIEKLEKDQTLTEICVDDVLEQLRKIRKGLVERVKNGSRPEKPADELTEKR